MARRVRRKICIVPCKFKKLYVFVQLAKSAFDERSGPVHRFRQLPIVAAFEIPGNRGNIHPEPPGGWRKGLTAEECPNGLPDRKSTRLNSSHSQISYAVFCLKKKKKTTATLITGVMTRHGSSLHRSTCGCYHCWRRVLTAGLLEYLTSRRERSL